MYALQSLDRKVVNNVWTAMDKLMNEIATYLAFMDIVREPVTLADRLRPYTLHR